MMLFATSRAVSNAQCSKTTQTLLATGVKANIINRQVLLHKRLVGAIQENVMDGHHVGDGRLLRVMSSVCMKSHMTNAFALQNHRNVLVYIIGQLNDLRWGEEMRHGRGHADLDKDGLFGSDHLSMVHLRCDAVTVDCAFIIASEQWSLFTLVHCGGAPGGGRGC